MPSPPTAQWRWRPSTLTTGPSAAPTTSHKPCSQASKKTWTTRPSTEPHQMRVHPGQAPASLCPSAGGPDRTSLRRPWSPGLLPLQAPGKAGHCSTQRVRLQSLATAVVLLRFCLGWCQTSYHARTMPPDSLLLGAQTIMKCLGGIIQGAITQEAWLRAQVSIKKENRYSTPQRPSWPPAAARQPCATPCGTPTKPHPTEMWLPLGHSPTSPSTTTQLGTQATRCAIRATCPTCVTRTHKTL